MASYVYPYDDFARDFDALCPSPNAAPRDFRVTMDDARHYFRRAYPDHPDYVTRGGMILFSLDYLLEHFAEFEERHTTVRERPISRVSDHLLQAIHQLVCLAALANHNNEPDLDEIVARANELALTDSQ